VASARNEHGFGFKSGGFSNLWWIWIGLKTFCLTRFGFDNLVWNFFATVSSVLVHSELYGRDERTVIFFDPDPVLIF